jgi:spore germination protein KB
MIILVVIMSTGVLFVPGITVDKAEQSAWISVMLSLPAGLMALGLTNALGKRFPRQTLAQYAGLLAGKVLGKLTGLGFLMFLLTVSVVIITEFSGYINNNLMPETPKFVLNGLLSLIAAYAAAKGIEVIARVIQFILPIFLFAIMAITLLSIIDINLGNLLPLMETDLIKVISGAIAPSTWMGQIVILAVLFPALNIQQEALRKGVSALSGAGILLMLLTIVTIGIFGSKLAGDLIFPFHALAKYVKFMTIERLEFLVIFIWVSGIVVKTAVFFYLESIIITQIFNIKSKTIIFSFLIAGQTILATYLSGNPQEVSKFITKTWPPIAFFFELAVPAGLLAIALIRGKKAVLKK